MGHIGGNRTPRIVKGIGVCPTNRTILRVHWVRYSAEKNFKGILYIVLGLYIKRLSRFRYLKNLDFTGFLFNSSLNNDFANS